MDKILRNNKVYSLYNYSTEDEFEKKIIEKSKFIFGENSIYIDIKKRIGNKILSIPDGYLIDYSFKNSPTLFIIENELSNHDPYRHIGSQMLRFAISYDESRYELILGETIILEGRENLMKRCILNIIGNGLAYGDKIVIEIKKSLNRAVITVEDNGPGIPKSEYLNVFKPFYRIDKSRGLNKAGVGLGLSISQDIIKSHGGNISLSESRFKGLLVKISFICPALLKASTVL